MATRKAAFKDDENPLKRQRVDDGMKASPPTACFDALNDDCAVHILSHLPLDDLNTFGMVNNRCRMLRNHESLDQSREAIIFCSRRARRATTLASLRTALESASRALNANYTCVKIFGLETVEDYLGDDEEDAGRSSNVRSVLSHVAALELVAHQQAGQSASIYIRGELVKKLENYFPNVMNLTMRGVFVHHLAGNVARKRQLSHLILKDCHIVFDAEFELGEQMNNEENRRLVEQLYSNQTLLTDVHVLYSCQHLESLDIKNIKWAWNLRGTTPQQSEPLPQGMIIKMVRRMQTLRWLRSDLTPENVAMLQRERPEITFVSE